MTDYLSTTLISGDGANAGTTTTYNTTLVTAAAAESTEYTIASSSEGMHVSTVTYSTTMTPSNATASGGATAIETVYVGGHTTTTICRTCSERSDYYVQTVMEIYSPVATAPASPSLATAPLMMDDEVAAWPNTSSSSVAPSSSSSSMESSSWSTFAVAPATVTLNQTISNYTTTVSMPGQSTVSTMVLTTTAFSVNSTTKTYTQPTTTTAWNTTTTSLPGTTVYRTQSASGPVWSGPWPGSSNVSASNSSTPAITSSSSLSVSVPAPNTTTSMGVNQTVSYNTSAPWVESSVTTLMGTAASTGATWTAPSWTGAWTGAMNSSSAKAPYANSTITTTSMFAATVSHTQSTTLPASYATWTGWKISSMPGATVYSTQSMTAANSTASQMNSSSSSNATVYSTAPTTASSSMWTVTAWNTSSSPGTPIGSLQTQPTGSGQHSIASQSNATSFRCTAVLSTQPAWNTSSSPDSPTGSLQTRPTGSGQHSMPSQWNATSFRCPAVPSTQPAWNTTPTGSLQTQPTGSDQHSMTSQWNATSFRCTAVPSTQPIYNSTATRWNMTSLATSTTAGTASASATNQGYDQTQGQRPNTTVTQPETAIRSTTPGLNTTATQIAATSTPALNISTSQGAITSLTSPNQTTTEHVTLTLTSYSTLYTTITRNGRTKTIATATVPISSVRTETQMSRIIPPSYYTTTETVMSTLTTCPSKPSCSVPVTSVLSIQTCNTYTVPGTMSALSNEPPSSTAAAAISYTPSTVWATSVTTIFGCSSQTPKCSSLPQTVTSSIIISTTLCPVTSVTATASGSKGQMTPAGSVPLAAPSSDETTTLHTTLTQHSTSTQYSYVTMTRETAENTVTGGSAGASVSQISDGQAQASAVAGSPVVTSSQSANEGMVSQVSTSQPQAPESTTPALAMSTNMASGNSGNAVSQISDGQVQAPGASATADTVATATDAASGPASSYAKPASSSPLVSNVASAQQVTSLAAAAALVAAIAFML